MRILNKVKELYLNKKKLKDLPIKKRRVNKSLNNVNHNIETILVSRNIVEFKKDTEEPESELPPSSTHIQQQEELTSNKGPSMMKIQQKKKEILFKRSLFTMYKVTSKGSNPGKRIYLIDHGIHNNYIYWMVENIKNTKQIWWEYQKNLRLCTM